MIYYECVFVTLVIHQARRRRLITSPVTPLVAQYFSTLPHQWHDFRGGKNIEYKMCVLIFSANLSATFLILRKTERGTIQNVYWSSWKVNVILVKL